MQRYAEFAPTQFDTAGLGLEDRQDWLVAPVSQTRDSEALSRSNFRSLLKAIGGPSETVEVHRFGHWGPGWFEIILVAPGSPAEAICDEAESALEDYPVYDDMDFSALEYEEYGEWWARDGVADFADALEREHRLSTESVDLLIDVPAEIMRALYEDATPDGDYWNANGMRTRLEAAAKCVTRKQLADLLRSARTVRAEAA